MKMTPGFVVISILAALAVATTLEVKSTSQPTPTYPAPPCDLATDTASAYCEFEKLTNATSEWTELPPQPPIDPTNTQALPLWTHWVDKCALGLTPCVQARKPQRVKRKTSDLFAMSFPTQISRDEILHKLRMQINNKEPALAQELASVLFSPEIEKEAGGLSKVSALAGQLTAVTGENGPQREISTQLEPLSTVTKLIWEVVSNQAPAYVYDPMSKPSSDDSQLPDPIMWASTYPIAEKTEDKPCPDQDFPVAGNSTPIPINCFFHYSVSPADPEWGQLTVDLQTAVKASSITADQAGTKAYVILVGAHVMRFDEHHKLWQWMTFYWTPQVDPATPSTWKNPWKHYRMETTSVLQEGVSLTREPIANPYLEGHNDANGMSTNCVSCHSLAAYSTKGGKSGEAKSLVDAASCDPSTPGKGCYQVTENAANPGYYADAVRTHFLWSIATNPCLPQQNPPTPQSIQQLCPAPQQTQQPHTHHRQAAKPN